MRERIPPLLVISYGATLVVVPLLMSVVYKALNFRTALDILGGFYLLNAALFLVYSATIKCRQEGNASGGISEAEEGFLEKNPLSI